MWNEEQGGKVEMGLPLIFSSMQITACSFDKKDILGGKWFKLVSSVDLKVVNTAFSIYS